MQPVQSRIRFIEVIIHKEDGPFYTDPTEIPGGSTGGMEENQHSDFKQSPKMK